MEDGTKSQPLSSMYDIKKNEQSISMKQGVREFVTDKLYNNTFIDSAICPNFISVNFYNEYGEDSYYKKHIDAFKAQPKSANRYFDYGFSICLTDDYEGGEFVVENETGEFEYKLGAGQIFLFPIIYPHGVKPVTKGSRKAIIGWLSTNVTYEQSFILRNLYQVNASFIESKNEDMVLKSTLVQSYLKKLWGK
jgi:PKHD-type hydroxylase